MILDIPLAESRLSLRRALGIVPMDEVWLDSTDRENACRT
jgi:hypothetical protein